MTTETQAEMPFFESAEDATHSAIIASRKPLKEVALSLWPSMKMDSAYARLRGALNHDRPEKLSADEHIFIANHCEQYHFLHYIENQCHHAGSQRVTPADELAHLQQDILKGQQALTQAMNRYAALRQGVK
jgi:hypothetical protein